MRKRWEGETVVVGINFELWFPRATADGFVIVSRASKECYLSLLLQLPCLNSTFEVISPSPHRSVLTCASKEIYRAYSSSGTISCVALTKRVFTVLDSRLELEVS